MWHLILLLSICAALLILFSQQCLWRSALILMEAGHLRRQRHWAFWLPAVFFIAALLFGLLAFARLDKEDAPLVFEPPQLYVLLDCSLSMNAVAWAEDSRLEAAKKSLRDLPSALPDRELGLLTFAGETLLDFPPSGDHGGWLEALAAVAPERPPWSGSAPGTGMQAVAETRSLCPAGQAAVLLLCDGEVNVGNRQQEEEAWRQRDLPCLFVLVGEPGEKKTIPDSSGWLATMLPEEEPVSVAESREIERLLALSGSPFLSISGQAALQDRPGIAKSLEHLLRQSSGLSAERRVDAWVFLLLSAGCALLALFSSSSCCLPRLAVVPTVFFCVLISTSLSADEAAAIELCRQAAAMTEHPEDSQQALALYRRALRLQPGLELAARNLEYTLLQMQKMTSSKKNIDPNNEAETAHQTSDEKPDQAGALPPQSTELTDQQAAEKSSATAENGGTWRDLQKARGKVFRAPPKCKPW